MKRAAIRTNDKRYTFRRFFFLLLTLTILIVFFMSRALLTKAGGSADTSADTAAKKYMSYEVQAGDTLWDLAAEYNDFSLQDSSAYIDEVRSMNHLCGCEIHTGEYIVLPYFD